MTNAQHTPGPWGIELTDTAQWIGPMRSDGVKIADIICKVDWDSGYTDEVKQRLLANALLIASVPELLSALQRIVHVFWEHGGDINGIGISDFIIEKAEAAIARATGEAA